MLNPSVRKPVTVLVDAHCKGKVQNTYEHIYFDLTIHGYETFDKKATFILHSINLQLLSTHASYLIRAWHENAGG